MKDMPCSRVGSWTMRNDGALSSGLTLASSSSRVRSEPSDPTRSSRRSGESSEIQAISPARKNKMPARPRLDRP
eukprot:scaffold80_cov131-Pinguiococcus_pyrenoidosus.AAC.2